MDWFKSAIRIRLSNGLNFSRAEKRHGPPPLLGKTPTPTRIFITFGGPQGHKATLQSVLLGAHFGASFSQNRVNLYKIVVSK
jgi:hypothetical protein